MLKFLISSTLLLSLLSCRNLVDRGQTDTNDNTTNGTVVIDRSLYPDWTAETHSNAVDPNFSIVFPQNKVLRFDITVNASQWASMQSNLSSILGSDKERPGSERPGIEHPDMRGVDVGRRRAEDKGGMRPHGRPPGQAKDPMWVPCSLSFEGKEWYKVGLRYKGNSSLRSAYHSGIKKLSFKLDFDQFEDDYPELKNQRFYGFKQLNLNNNFLDASLVREKVGADLFRQFGLVSAQTTFCVVYLDSGSGPQYYGVYTLVEEVDNTVVATQFASGAGHLYKPDGGAASFALGTYNEREFELKTNKDSADCSDVKELYDVLHSATRSSDLGAWKSQLEGVFDVAVFLKYLAANSTIQNWDTYGRMGHNYYLYNNPDNNLLTWIPWDNNEAFGFGKQGGALSLGFSEVSSSWPLVNYLMAVDEYRTSYEEYLKQFVDEVFAPSDMEILYERYFTLLKEYAYAEEKGYTFIQSDVGFDSAIATLKKHAKTRCGAVNRYLN